MNRCAKSGKVKFPKVRSVIGQYIRGEKTLQDIVHPSKLTKISRYESQIRQNRSTLRSQRSASPRVLKSAESYPANPIVTTIESEDDDIDKARYVDSNSLCKMGDSLAVRGLSLKNDTSIWPTSSSSPPPPPSASIRLSRRSRTKIDDENTRIGSQAEQIAAMATMTKTKTFLVEDQNSKNLRKQSEENHKSVAANVPRTQLTLRPPSPATIKDEPDTIRSRSHNFSPSIDQQLTGSCDSSRTTSITDSYECFTENFNPSDISTVAENPQSSDFKTVSGYSEDDDETTELDISKRYLEEKINRQRVQIDELNEEIKKARHIRDDYQAAAAKIVTEGEFETVLREFLTSSETWFRSDSKVSSDSVIRDYFTKCYDDLRKKVQQCESQLKVSNIFVDNLEKDKTRLQNYIVKLKNTRTNVINIPLGVH